MQSNFTNQFQTFSNLLINSKLRETFNKIECGQITVNINSDNSVRIEINDLQSNNTKLIFSKINLANEIGQKYGQLDKQENLFDPEGAYKLGINQFLFKNFGSLGYKIDASFIYYRNFLDGYLLVNAKSFAAKKYRTPQFEPLVIDHFMYLYYIHRDKKPNIIYAYYNAYLLENMQKMRYLDQHKMLTTKGIMLIDNINRCGFNGLNIKCLSENYRILSEISMFLEKVRLE